MVIIIQVNCSADACAIFPGKKMFSFKIRSSRPKKLNKNVKLKRLSKSNLLANIVFNRHSTDTRTKSDKIKKHKDRYNIQKRREPNISYSNFFFRYLHPKYLQLNPYKEFRFMDWVLPLDSSMFEEFNTKTFSPIQGLEKIKRVVKSVNDKVKKEYRMYVEDIDPTSIDPTNLCNQNQLCYLLEWQESLNNKTALDFKNSLIEFFKRNTIANDYNEISDRVNQNPKVFKNRVSSNLKNKAYINMIDPVTQEWINSKPNFTRQSKITGCRNISNLCKITLNYSFCEMFKTEQDHSYPDILTQANHICSTDIYGFQKTRSGIRKPIQECEGLVVPKEYPHHVMLLDGYGNKIRGTFVSYDEKYIKEGSIYNKSTGVFLKEDPI